MLSYLGSNFLVARNLFMQNRLLCSAASQFFIMDIKAWPQVV